MKRKTLEDARLLAQGRGGACLSSSYLDSNHPLIWMCSEGHTWEAPYKRIFAGSWCAHCAGMSRLTIEEMQRIAQSRGGECLSPQYMGKRTHLIWRCHDRHTWRARPMSIRAGTWCPECCSHVAENLCRQAFEFLMQEPFPRAYPEWLRNTSTGRKLELDGYCEPLRLAFEYHGEQHYRYSKLFHKTPEGLARRQQMDQRKAELCASKGVTLVEVPFFARHPMEDIGSKILSLLLAAGVTPRTVDLSGFNPILHTAHNLFYAQLVHVVEGKGGKVLSSHYVSSQTKMEFSCGLGHRWWAIPNSLKQGSWCRVCYKNARLGRNDEP